jgi:hypothetical protein
MTSEVAADFHLSLAGVESSGDALSCWDMNHEGIFDKIESSYIRFWGRQ